MSILLSDSIQFNTRQRFHIFPYCFAAQNLFNDKSVVLERCFGLKAFIWLSQAREKGLFDILAAKKNAKQ